MKNIVVEGKEPVVVIDDVEIVVGSLQAGPEKFDKHMQNAKVDANCMQEPPLAQGLGEQILS